MTQPAAIPIDEAQRLARLRALAVLDTGPEALFDAIARVAADVCGAPISLVSLVDESRQWFKANVGLDGATETPRDIAFCAHAILGDEVMEVRDAASDPRFGQNPLVTDAPGIRFYAGAPLCLSDGSRVGTLCVIDRQPRALSAQQLSVLRNLAVVVAQGLEAREKSIAAVQSLVASEARQTQGYRATPAMLHTFNPDGVIVEVSDHWLNMLGYTREEVLARKFAEFLTETSQRCVLETVLPAFFVAGRCEDVACQLVRKDGGVIDVLFSALLERDEQGAPARAMAVITDVTARKRAEASLAAEMGFTRTVLQSVLDGIVTIDAKGIVRSMNPAALLIFGYALEEVLGQNVSLLMPEQDARQHDAHLRHHTTTGQARVIGKGRELYGRRKDGSVFPMELLVSRAEHEGGAIFVGVMRDISLRKQQEALMAAARQSLADLNHKFQVATQAAGVGVWEWDVPGNRLIWDEMMYVLYGIADRPEGMAVYDHWKKAVHPDDQQASHMAIHMALQGVKEFDCEFRVVWPDGQIRYIQARASVERNAEGAPMRMLGTNWDITEQRLAEEALRASKGFLERTGAVAGVGGWEVDIRSGRIHWSDETCALHDVPAGYQPDLDEAIEFYAPEARPVVQQAVARAMSSGEPWDMELPFVSRKGRRFWARAVGNVEYEDGQPVRLVGALQDVTLRKEMEQRLARSRELLQVTLDSIGDAVITTDVDGSVQWLNPVAETLTGWTKAEALGRQLMQVFVIVNEQTREPAENPVKACLEQGKVVGLANHSTLISRSGIEYGIEDSASPIRDEQGNVHGAVLVFHDVSEQRRLSNEMSHRATHDVLTGLANRLEFENRLGRMLTQARLAQGRGALLYIDLDQFKLVNDACGHGVGDQLLQQVSKLFQQCVRGRDTVARLGGDEFGILLEHCDAEQALRVAQGICDQMEEFRFLHDGRRFRVGASIGLVPVDDRWASMSAVLQAADSSCYAAKEAGRNRVHPWFDTDAALKARHGEMQWVARLEQAFDDKRFELFGQRIVPITESSPGLHFEVLLRLRDERAALIPPGAFLPAAERFHLITRIDKWVVRSVFEWFAQLGDEVGMIEMVSINLSGQSIGDRAFHQHLIEKLSGASFDVGKLCFEITETSAIGNMADARDFITDIRRLGARIALDDFGAGASSFGYLKALPVDFLKIDGQFITGLLEDPLDKAAVRCFHDVAKVVGVRTIAEFVENEAVLAVLREIGINMAQGYLIHKPEPISLCAARSLA
jgi:diguanylate cyclase